MTPKPRLSDSIFIRVLAFVVAMVLVTAAILTQASFRVADTVANDSIQKLGSELTSIVSQEAGGAIKFRKVEELTALLETTRDRLGGSVLGGVFTDSTGEVLAETSGSSASVQALTALAKRAVETETIARDETGMMVAHPVRFGASNGVIGAIAMTWTVDELKANSVQTKQMVLVATATVFLILVVTLAIVLRRMIVSPLRNLSWAMTEIASENYDIEIPKTRRGSEIGAVTTTLEDFRSKLMASQQSAKIASFQGAGFRNSSAALMIANRDFEITFTNPAFQTLMSERESIMREHLPQFDLSTMVGTNIDTFHSDPGRIRMFLQNLTGSHAAELEFGDLIMGLAISSIEEDGERLGYVVEWKDITEARRNAAVLDTFETKQAMAEFDRLGRLVSGNAVVSELCGRSIDALKGKRLTDLVMHADGREIGAISDGIFGDFQTISSTGDNGFLVGGLTPIRNKSGEIIRTILIGADVTDQRRKILDGEREQEKMRAQQEQMIAELSQGLASLSSGDLAVKLETPFAQEHDQLRSDFNSAVQTLHNTISGVSERARGIRSDTNDISSAADDLSRRTEHQAATLEESAAALTELTTSVSSTAGAARQANEVVREAQANAERSESVVQDAVSAMGEIADSSSKISSIISVIDDIAFQTNLLALNAGVEAARAGDAGRGFAVVASEVRALAQRSSDAAREINSLISASGEHVERGVELVGNAGEALKSIFASVTGISDHVSDIAASAQEQSTGLDEINAAMGQLDQVTQQNVAMFEETTAASQALSEASEELAAAVAQFKVGGSHPPEKTVRTPSVETRATGTDDAPARGSEHALDEDWVDF